MFNDVNAKTCSGFLQSTRTPDNMMKKGKKKSRTGEYESDAEISPVSRIEIIYKDTKVVTGAKPEFKWGQIYHMLV